MLNVDMLEILQLFKNVSGHDLNFTCGEEIWHLT